MILGKLMKSLGVGGKVLPNSGGGSSFKGMYSSSSSASGSASSASFGGRSSSSFSTSSNPTFKTKQATGNNKRNSSSSDSSSSSNSRKGSDLSSLSKTSSLPTIVEEENFDGHNQRGVTSRTARDPEYDSDCEVDDDGLSTGSRTSPPQDLRKVLHLLKGQNNDLDVILIGFERVQEIVWACMDTELESTIRFNSLDPSTVPPPDIRNLESIAPVEALLKAMIRTKDFERKLRRHPECSDICEEALKTLERHQKSIDKTTFTFVSNALKLLMDKTSPAGTFDEEILVRLSSVIRFYLRLALNARKNFSPIVLSRQAKSFYDSQIPNGDMLDLPHPELNVAALFHQALTLVAEADSLMEAHEALKLRSAKKFIQNVLACAKRIEGVDEKRKKAWQMAQKWSVEIRRLFPDDLRDLAFLSDPARLQDHVSKDVGLGQDLALLELRREGLQEKRGGGASAKELRAMRAQMTGMCGRNGHFPEVVFILDA